MALLADGDRLRVVAALVLGATTMVELTESTRLSVRGAGRAVVRLIEGGLVGRDDGGSYRLAEDVLRASARASFVQHRAAVGDSGRGDTVGGPFVKDGRLLSIPAGHTKRLQVLDLIVQDFEIGHRYPEKRVNEILSKWYSDHATLRRSLVDAGFLERAGGGGDYWRGGGSVTV